MKCRKYKPSKAEAAAFAQKMAEIDDFCYENGIYSSYNNDSYYFTIDGQEYCVSGHSVDTPNSKVFDIHANKTRLIEIYLDIKAGHKIDGRGYRID